MRPLAPRARGGLARGRGGVLRRAAALLQVGSRWIGRGSRRAIASPIVRNGARAGFLAKVAVYGVIGALALRAALGLGGGGTIDPTGAFTVILLSGRFGDVAVVGVAASIAALGLFFLLEAVGNPSRAPSGLWNIVARVGQSIGGVGYVALGYAGILVALGEGGPSGDAIARAWVARVVAQPTGPWAASIVGLVTIGVGLRQAVRGLLRGFLDVIDLSRATRAFRAVAIATGTFGFAVQGTLFALVGAFIIRAALERNPAVATGTAGALAALAARPSGATLLLGASAGLLAYALFAAIEGAARRYP